MSQYPINMMQGTAAERWPNLDGVAESPAIAAAPGALGLRVNQGAWSASARRLDLSVGVNVTGNVTASQAQSALDNLFDALPSGTPSRPTLGQFVTLDVATLSLLVNGLMQDVCAKNADILCQQIKRASDVQNVLRDKQLKDYQAQINKAAEQADKVRKAAIFNVVCDWIVSTVQVVVGALRVMAGDVVGGTATILNGVAGMVKAAAETAILCGADKEACEKVIQVATVIQMITGMIAMVGGGMASAADAGKLMGGTNFVSYLRAGNSGVDSLNQVVKSATSMAVATLQEQIEGLMADQSFNGGVQKWVETRKSTQYQELRDTFQDSMQARKSALHNINNHGTVLAQVVSGRA